MKHTLSQKEKEDVLQTKKIRVRRKMVIAALIFTGSLSELGEDSNMRHFTCKKREIIEITEGRTKGINTQNKRTG